MPTYEYACDACDHTFDEMQSFSDEPLTKCPVCKKKKLRRLFGTGASIIFKGSGFYETDYRSESYKAGAKADESAAKPAPCAEGGCEKPACPAKAESAPAKAGGTKAAKAKAGTTGKVD
ncbi:MAG: zinc ribbon domain-containing protein [Gemmataceae bacterium]